jgi:hypothetical protein
MEKAELGVVKKDRLFLDVIIRATVILWARAAAWLTLTNWPQCPGYIESSYANNGQDNKGLRIHLLLQKDVAGHNPRPNRYSRLPI